MLLLSACAEPAPDDDTAEACDPGVQAVLPVTSGGLVYELYVRSFYDADGDTYGDLAGLTEKLPYLQALGVDTVWLMPIFEAYGPAGYDVKDFRSIDADYGGEEDFRAAIAAAAELGIRLIVDVPINHTSHEHEWFLAADADPDSIFRDLYLYGEAQYDEYRWFESASEGWYYAFFGEDLPDLDWTNSAVEAEMTDMLADWLLVNPGGFRLDAVIQLIEADGVISDSDDTHCLLTQLYKHLKASAPDALLVSEAWHDDVAGAQSYLGDLDAAQADWVLDIPRHTAFEEAWASGDPSEIRAVLTEEMEGNALGRLAPYLGNHDLDRLPTRVPDERARRAWMVGHILLPGHPVLYYGEELDLPQEEEAEGFDLPMRRPFPWTGREFAGFSTTSPWYPPHDSYLEGINAEDEGVDPTSMLSLTRALAALRLGSDVVRSETLRLLDVSDPALLAFAREGIDGDAVVVVLSFSSGMVDEATVAIAGEWIHATGGGERVGGEQLELGDLGPFDYRVFVGEELADFAVPAQR